MGSEVLMADGALKRQGDSLAPQGVVCRVRQTADIATVGGHNQPVPFAVKEFDSFGGFDAAASRFQPKIAGYYRCTSSITVSGLGGNGVEVDLYMRKNGAGANASGSFAGGMAGTVAGGWAVVEAIGTVYLNGTTDYVDLSLWCGAAGLMRGTASPYPYFEAELIGVTAGVIPEPWTPVAFNSNWTDYGAAGYQPAAYYRNPYGEVQFRGIVKNVGGFTFGSATGSLLTVPAGYRPGSRGKRPCSGFDTGAGNCIFHLLIDPSDGILVIDSTTPGGASGAVGGYIFLDSLRWRAEA